MDLQQYSVRNHEDRKSVLRDSGVVVDGPRAWIGQKAFGSGILMDPASISSARYLGDQGDMEIRWSPAPHFIAAFNLAGFQPGAFFDHVVNNRPPIAANAGLTFRF